MKPDELVMAAAGSSTAGGGSGGSSTLYVDDVFSTYLYTGNGSTQTINNGIDLAGSGGMVWSATRVGTEGNGPEIIDTARGGSYRLLTSTTQAAFNCSDPITFNSNGFSMSPTGNTYINYSGFSKVAWTFRKAPKFFDIVTWTGDGNASRAIPHSLGIGYGLVLVKRTDSTSDWGVYARDTSGAFWRLVFNTTAAYTGLYSEFQSSTVFYPSDFHSTAYNVSGGTYVAYLFAHDTSATSMIKCGSFTTDGSGNATVNLGFEPQYIMGKVSSAAGYSWEITDSMRGLITWNGGSSYSQRLKANSAEIEANSTYGPTSTGFTFNNGPTSTTFIYMAIRRPNKPPTSGTQVYNAIARAGTGAAATVTGVGFSPDFSIIMERNRGAINVFLDKLRGATKFINSTNTSGELTIPDNIFFNQDGITVGADTGGYGNNQSSITYINHFFKRAPGFMDIVCYTGNGGSGANAVPHNLTVEPELVIVKSRTTATYNEWYVYNKYSGNGKTLHLNGNYLAYNFPNWGNTSPTTNVFTVNASYTNDSQPYVAYLFATLAGISKVGSYTGNGSSQTINCGFAAGARFILIKRTDAAGDWYVWDSARGIVGANDPHLSLNTTAVEVATDDSIDPDNSGFIVNQVAATNINVTSATYIYLAIA